MEQLFWVIPGRLAGRPGPDMEPWDLAALREGGIGAVLSVNDGRLCRPEEFAARGIAHACVPLPDTAPPRPGDDQVCMTALPRAYAFVHAEMERGHGVVVHCTAGKDRTGLFLAYFHMQHSGLCVAGAIQEVRRVRPVALSALGWEAFAGEVLHRIGR
jgi:protein-tyrosine phosphatase